MEKSSFFNSVSHDRKYSAEDWAAYFASFIRNGVFGQPSNSLQVIANSGMNITIKAGSGFINGYYYRNTTDMIKTLAVADGVYNRIDRVVLRWSLINRNITIQVLQGSVTQVPAVPALTRNAEIYELALADIYIGAGSTSVQQSRITDKRGDGSVCGIVTSVIQQVDLTSFMAQFDAWIGDSEKEFETWFAEVQGQLSGDVAGNLQNQINALKYLTFENTPVPASAFVADTTYEDYPYRAAVPLSGVLSSMIPEVVFSVPDATSGNFAPASAAYNGGVYIYAASPPEEDITIPTIICWKGA